MESLSHLLILLLGLHSRLSLSQSILGTMIRLAETRICMGVLKVDCRSVLFNWGTLRSTTKIRNLMVPMVEVNVWKQELSRTTDTLR